MNRYFQKFVRLALVAALVLGPLQAQAVFACTMMDMVLDECCCDAHITGREGDDVETESALDSVEAPCCERLVEVRIDEDARDDTRIVKPFEIRSDIDPPNPIAVPVDPSGDLFAEQNQRLLTIPRSPLYARHPGSKTYLATRRLRI